MLPLSSHQPRYALSAARGFTLIELLMVIAIIGILSGITLALLSTSSSKGADTAVKANLRTVVKQSYTFFETYNK